MRGMLWFLILFFIKKPVHSQKLSEEIVVRKGERNPRLGTIYPHLNLKEMGLIFDEEKEGKSITYKLKPKGR
jgi:DNA-binding PadR family transcriptional regulator